MHRAGPLHDSAASCQVSYQTRQATAYGRFEADDWRQHCHPLVQREAGQTSTDSFLLFQADSEVTPTGPIFVRTSYLELCHSLWTDWLRLD